MKLNCEKAILQAAISTASRAVSSKSTIPALEGLLLEASRETGTLTITGYNQETGIRSTVQADVEESGTVVVTARLFSEIIRKMPDDTIRFIEENLKISISCGKVRFNLVGISPEDFPELPTVETKNSLSIKEQTLRSMIDQTIFAVSTDQSRPIHTGTLFSVEENNLTLVAVDGFRLAMRSETIEFGEEPFEFVVPGASLSEVQKICRDTDEKLSINLGTRHIMFQFDSTVLISRRLEGKFLDWKAAVPRKNPIFVTADTQALLSSIERVSLIVSEKLKSPLHCTIGSGEISISTNTALGSAADACPVEGDGSGLEIGFNNRYMIDALRAVPAEKIKLEFTSPVTPCIIVPAEGEENFLFMVLPVRLKSNYN